MPISEEGLAKIYFVQCTPLLQVSYNEAGGEHWSKGTSQLCVRHREGRERCRRGAYCERLHIVPTRDCTNKDYLTTGICSNYSRCRSRHPWDEEAWGDKDIAYRKHTHTHTHTPKGNKSVLKQPHRRTSTSRQKRPKEKAASH